MIICSLPTRTANHPQSPRLGTFPDRPGSARAGRVGVAIALAALASTALAARPPVTQLLPDDTLACVRITNTPELLSKLAETATGRMLQDPQLQPLVKQLYQSAADAFRGIEQKLGLSLAELRAIPQGETCLALVASLQKGPAFLILLDAGSQAANGRRVVQWLQSRMEQRGDQRSEDKWEDVPLTVLTRAGSTGQQSVFCELEGTIIVSSDLELAKAVLSAWRKQDVLTLAENAQYRAIMQRCGSEDVVPPQLTYFIDPLGILRNIAANNMGLQMGLALLRPLGLEGIRGLGGSLLLDGPEFASVHHLHLLLDSPRTGVLQALSPRAGDVTAEPWVPRDVATYMTLHWDLPASYAALVTAFGQFRGPDAWEATILKPVREQFGVDLKRDLLDSMEGRITRITWTNEPLLERRVATLTGLKLQNAAAFEPILRSVATRVAADATRRTYQGVTCYQYTPRQMPSSRVARLPSESYLAVLGDYLLISDDATLLERAIDTQRGAVPPLVDQLDYKLNASKITRLPGGNRPCMVSFKRPEVGLRSSYSLLQAEATQTRLKELADQNAVIGSIHSALTQHPLPPFHVLAKYFAFSGRLVTSDETGIHSMGFTFHRK